MIKKKKRDAKQTTLLKELKKMKFPVLLKHKKLASRTIQNNNSSDITLSSSGMIAEATTNAETKNYAELIHTTQRLVLLIFNYQIMNNKVQAKIIYNYPEYKSWLVQMFRIEFTKIANKINLQ